MRLSYKKKLVEILRICDEFNRLSKSRKWLKEKLREAIASLSSFNMREKAILYDAAFQTATQPSVSTDMITASSGAGSGSVAGKKTNIDFSDKEVCKELVQVMGKLERHTDSRDKKQKIRNMMLKARYTDDLASGRFPIVFYACSKHSNPAKDHKDYQGKIYIDRYWRKYSTGVMPDWLIAAVDDYVKKNDVVSVQKIMGPPVWLGVRPYCKHFFYPVKTLSALTEVQKELVPITHGRSTKRGATYEYIKKHL